MSVEFSYIYGAILNSQGVDASFTSINSSLSILEAGKALTTDRRDKPAPAWVKNS